MKTTLTFLIVIMALSVNAQTGSSSSALAELVMLGKHNPATYLPPVVISHPDSVTRHILKNVSPDSLHKYLVELSYFKNRNTASDTVSNVKGIGAARRWIHKKFQQYSLVNSNRLIPAYLNFTINVCGIIQHKNVFAVLPGNDTTQKGIVLIEGHVDSRCEDNCDTSCVAEGMEDNGSGTALVLELARVMSKYTFNRTIVFMATTGEEQGLVGATAFANYATQKGIKIHAVLNNDVIGGVICGNTSSPPSCSGAGTIDSTNVRLFSQGGFNSKHKQFARFSKLQYKEMILPYATVPMSLHIMTPEDRTGRGGDHIPFRANGFTAIRFTSANEHGDANVTQQGYNDRQHTTTDVLGVDTDADMHLDSFFVDFNYLGRNTVINGNAAAIAAIGPAIPDFSYTALPTPGQGMVTITNQTQHNKYRLALRTTTNDWDTVYTWTGSLTFSFTLPAQSAIASVAAVDPNNAESLFSKELIITGTVVGIPEIPNPVVLLHNKPNPSDEATTISIQVNKGLAMNNALIEVSDISGRVVEKIPLQLKEGYNETEYNHGYHHSGIYFLNLLIDGKRMATAKMVFEK